MENFLEWPRLGEDLEEGELPGDLPDYEDEGEVSISRKFMFHALGKLSSEVYLLMC